MRVLNRDSTADEQPTIVKSPTPVDFKDMAGKKSATQQPIGTRNGRVTSPRPKSTFTTDVGPGMDFKGSHYIKLEDVLVSDIETSVKFLTKDVSTGFF